MNEYEQATQNALSFQTLAGNAVLLEIGARLGLVDALLSQEKITVSEMAFRSGVSEDFVSAYYSALELCWIGAEPPESSFGNTLFCLSESFEVEPSW